MLEIDRLQVVTENKMGYKRYNIYVNVLPRNIEVPLRWKYWMLSDIKTLQATLSACIA